VHGGITATISVHKTYQGAYKALRTFLIEIYDEWYDRPKKYRTKKVFDENQIFYIKRIKIEE